MHFDPTTGIEITEYLETHRACTNGDMKNLEIAASCVGLYKAFHELDPLPVTTTIFDHIEEHLGQARELKVRTPGFTEPLLREYQAARDAMAASGFDIVPCHNDPMPGNFLIGPGLPMKLIDFEFASNNERSYDFAVLFTEFFYDEPTLMQCIEEAFGSTAWTTVARVQVCCALADVKWGLWGIVNQQLNTTWDYDFHKYGLWKLARAYAKVSDPRWPQWLAAL
jgi:thiamine kinase-like enzyme